MTLAPFMRDLIRSNSKVLLSSSSSSISSDCQIEVVSDNARLDKNVSQVPLPLVDQWRDRQSSNLSDGRNNCSGSKKKDGERRDRWRRMARHQSDSCLHAPKRPCQSPPGRNAACGGDSISSINVGELVTMAKNIAMIPLPPAPPGSTPSSTVGRELSRPRKWRYSPTISKKEYINLHGGKRMLRWKNESGLPSVRGVTTTEDEDSSKNGTSKSNKRLVMESVNEILHPSSRTTRRTTASRSTFSTATSSQDTALKIPERFKSPHANIERRKLKIVTQSPDQDDDDDKNMAEIVTTAASTTAASVTVTTTSKRKTTKKKNVKTKTKEKSSVDRLAPAPLLVERE